VVIDWHQAVLKSISNDSCVPAELLVGSLSHTAF